MLYPGEPCTESPAPKCGPKVWVRRYCYEDFVYAVLWFDGVTMWRGLGLTAEHAARNLDCLLWDCDLW